MGRGKEEAAWLSGQRAGLAILWSQIRVPLWLLAGFVAQLSRVQILGHPFK